MTDLLPITGEVDLDEPPRRDRTRRTRPRTRLDKFPRDPLLRWAVRAALALPYVAIALLGGMGSADKLVTPNQQLLVHLSTLSWDRADPEWVGQIYPPVTTLAAAVIPGGRFGLALAGALVAGLFLQKLMEIMVQRRFPPSTVVILTLAIGANPLFAYTATENFAAFVGLACFGLAAPDVVRFVAWRNTRAGFRAGILLMVAMLSDLSGILYTLTAALAAPFLRLGRAGQSGARWANVLVIVYPTISALLAIFTINWIFTGNPLLIWTQEMIESAPQRLATLGEIFQTPNGWLLAAPVVCAWLIALIVRRPGSIAVSTLVFVAILSAYVLGLIPSGSAGNTFILMTVMAIALVPTARSTATIILTDAVAVLQIAIAWAAAFNRDSVVAWMSALGFPVG